MSNEYFYLALFLLYFMSLFWFISFHHNTERAWRWWSNRQSKYLFYEAEKIRNGLLQDSCAMRRILESLLTDEVNISSELSQDYLIKIDKIYRSLEELSDRLAPINAEYSLPLGIESLVALWHKKNPYLKISIEIPQDWRQEPPELSLVILQIIDELIQINLLNELLNRDISIYLKLENNIAKLLVSMSYSDKANLKFYNKSANLEYLSKTFEVLTSGKCYRRQKNLTEIWDFQWSEQGKL